MADKPLTLNQMLGALDKETANEVGKKLKKLSKRKQLKAPDDLQLAKLQRQSAYSETTKDISKWEPLVKQNRKAKLSFPLDRQKNHLESSVEASFTPRNELEAEIHQQLLGGDGADNGLQDGELGGLTAKEKKYLKSISAEEAKERLKEMQKTRVLLNTFGAKMKRQKKIKSKSYRRLLKNERIKNHIKKVETNEDKLMDEIERLHKIRAQERASLKHKNTGKWAKHAKFRAKYDEEARNALVEQIGVANKLRERAAVPQSDSEEDEDESDQQDDDDEEDESAASDDAESVVGAANEEVEAQLDEVAKDRLIVSSELLNEQQSSSSRKRKSSRSDDDGSDVEADGDGDDDEDDGEDEQRKLMSEAFANDDVVGEFRSLKSKMADEEQPKDLNLFLPGWGDWAGPGLKVNKRKKKKFVVKAKKVNRKDQSLSNVIISERANEGMKELQVRRLPRGVRNDNHLEKILTRPVVSTFVNQTSHREATRPRIETRLGARIEPLSENLVREGGEGYKAKWK